MAGFLSDIPSPDWVHILSVLYGEFPVEPKVRQNAATEAEICMSRYPERGVYSRDLARTVSASELQQRIREVHRAGGKFRSTVADLIRRHYLDVIAPPDGTTSLDLLAQLLTLLATEGGWACWPTGQPGEWDGPDIPGPAEAERILVRLREETRAVIRGVQSVVDDLE